MGWIDAQCIESHETIRGLKPLHLEWLGQENRAQGRTPRNLIQLQSEQEAPAEKTEHHQLEKEVDQLSQKLGEEPLMNRAAAVKN